jgi:hypothetical protein
LQGFLSGEVIAGDMLETLPEREFAATLEGCKARQAARAKAEAERLGARRAAKPLTVGRRRGHHRELTLRAAAAEFVEHHRGAINVVDGRLELKSPPVDHSIFGQCMPSASTFCSRPSR